MKLTSSCWSTVSALCLLTGASTASATPLPTFYQGRTLGMGGSSLAYTDDATAAATNPANLDGIERWSATGTFAPAFGANSAPFVPGGESHSQRDLFPLGFVGFGVRVFDRLVTGLAVYTESGAGAKFAAVPELGGMNMAMQLGVIEAALPVSYAINDQLSVGASLRMGYAIMSADMPGMSPAGQMRVQQNMHGFGFPGVSLGVRYRPIEELSLAVNYRSKLTMPLSGDGTGTIPAVGTQGLKLESEWSTPHSFGIGGAYSMLAKRLLIATEVRYVLLDEAVNDMKTTISMQGQSTPMESSMALQWKNSLVWSTGIEYRVASWAPLRVGYSMTTSGTRREYAAALTLAPGVLHGLHAGAGVVLDEVAVDLGAFYGFASSKVDNSSNGPNGTYSSDMFLISLSATYRPGAAAPRAPLAYAR